MLDAPVPHRKSVLYQLHVANINACDNPEVKVLLALKLKGVK
jgi:hypothetical protein